VAWAETSVGAPAVWAEAPEQQRVYSLALDVDAIGTEAGGIVYIVREQLTFMGEQILATDLPDTDIYSDQALFYFPTLGRSLTFPGVTIYVDKGVYYSDDWVTWTLANSMLTGYMLIDVNWQTADKSIVYVMAADISTHELILLSTVNGIEWPEIPWAVSVVGDPYVDVVRWFVLDGKAYAVLERDSGDEAYLTFTDEGTAVELAQAAFPFIEYILNNGIYTFRSLPSGLVVGIARNAVTYGHSVYMFSGGALLGVAVLPETPLLGNTLYPRLIESAVAGELGRLFLGQAEYAIKTSAEGGLLLTEVRAYGGAWKRVGHCSVRPQWDTPPSAASVWT